MKIINIGILAHVDAGKTTLTESLLYASLVDLVDKDNGGNVHFPQGMEQNTGLGLHAIFSGDHQDGPI